MVVAKIYDPLYFDDEGYLSPFRFMDRSYTHEAHMYTLFSSNEKHKQVELPVPKFYGSYSLDIATKSGGFRTVRLILLEHIEGMLMLDMEPEMFPQHIQEQMLKSLIDFESLLFSRNI